MLFGRFEVLRAQQQQRITYRHAPVSLCYRVALGLRLLCRNSTVSKFILDLISNAMYQTLLFNLQLHARMTFAAAIGVALLSAALLITQSSAQSEYRI